MCTCHDINVDLIDRQSMRDYCVDLVNCVPNIQSSLQKPLSELCVGLKPTAELGLGPVIQNGGVPRPRKNIVGRLHVFDMAARVTTRGRIAEIERQNTPNQRKRSGP